jgi:hypothetical protein
VSLGLGLSLYSGVLRLAPCSGEYTVHSGNVAVCYDLASVTVSSASAC